MDTLKVYILKTFFDLVKYCLHSSVTNYNAQIDIL